MVASLTASVLECLTCGLKTLISHNNFSQRFLLSGVTAPHSLSVEVDMKRLPEKLMIGAIILSCGFVMQSEPTPQPDKGKAADMRMKRMKQSISYSADVRDTIRDARPGDRTP